MQQSSLFKNIPKINEAVIRQQNKDILSKAGKKQTGPATVKVTSTNKIIQMVEIIKQNAAKELVDDGSYHLITADFEFIAYIDEVIKRGEAALDTEGTGLDPLIDKVVGICLYAPGLKPMYAPCDHTDVYGKRIDKQVSLECVAAQLQRLVDYRVSLYFHNAKYDCRMIRNNFGVKIFPAWCTLIGGNLLNENEPHGLKFLWNKYCNKSGKDTSSQTFGNLFSEDEYKLPFNYVPIEIGYLYAAKDSLMTFELVAFQMMYLKEENEACQKQKLIEAAHLFNKVELPLIPVVADMEDEGIAVDHELGKKLSVKYNLRLIDVLKKINEFLNTVNFYELQPELRDKLSPEKFEVRDDDGKVIESVNVRINIGSPTQLAILLYDLFGLTSGDREKPRGTGEEILENIKAKQGTPPDIKFFLSDVLDYRGIKKLLSTYIDKLPAEVKAKTGKLHGSFNQYGAKTGRFSSSGPNLQNIPSQGEAKETRKLFVAEEGYVFVGGDFSQQEPRILAHLCFALFGDSRMSDAYRDGKDLYAWSASEVYQVPYEECKEFRPDGSKNPEGKERRNSCKSIILGVMYGRGANAIAEQLGWTSEQAQKIVDMFFNTFPAVKQVIDYYQTMARELGYVMTVWGRKRRLPEINLPQFSCEMKKIEGVEVAEEVDPEVEAFFVSRMEKAWGNKQKNIIKAEADKMGIRIRDNGGKIADAERQCLNSVVQGTASDITKVAMVIVGSDLILKELGFKLILTVHDELIGKCPRENALQAARRMEELMLSAAADKISVPMSVDAEIVARWSGEDITKELEDEFGVAS